MMSRNLLSVPRLIVTSSRNAAYWNKDWSPGKVPETDAEKEAAAKKYGLMKEEYQSRADDGYGIGDYPDPPPLSAESRDIFYPWDYPEYRRNYGELIHPEGHFFGEDRYDISGKPRFSLSYQLACFLGAMVSTGLVTYWLRDTMMMPAKAKPLPIDGKVHYSFPQ